jgi:hypothetical protein
MAVVGGTTSVITGGKFANGAESGAFVHLFNAEQRGFIEGVKEFGRMFGRALEFITFRGEAMESVPYNKVGADAVSAVQNAHPAAQAVLVVSGAQVALGGIYGAELALNPLLSTPNGIYTFSESILNQGVTTSSMSNGIGQFGNALGQIIRGVTP